MRTRLHVIRFSLIATVLCNAFLFCLLAPSPVRAQGVCISLTAPGSPYYQDFNTLSNAANTTTNNPTIPGWYISETGGSVRDNEQYAVDTGSSATGDTYSYGASGNPERALGGLRTTSLIPSFGACFTNHTGSVISGLHIAYTGEEWRLGSTGHTDRIDFQLSTDATSLNTGHWTDHHSLDFSTPNNRDAMGARNGNSAAYQAALVSTLADLRIPNGSTFWIRWLDFDASSYDDGLAVDDFLLTPQGPVLPNLSINDVSLKEGDNGPTLFTFTVSLSAPAPAGGVTFDLVTADNTALAPSDYAARSLTGQTLPAGSSTYTFDVTASGDRDVESDEIFFVNIANVNGAVVTDGQGQGTITNDDTTTIITTSGSPSGYGIPVTFTATVIEPGAGTPTGTVEFFDGTVSLGSVTLDTGGQAALTTASLTTGSHTLTAIYAGETGFTGSTSPGMIQVVEGPPGVERVHSMADTGDGQIVENERTGTALTQLLVVFNKAMNPADATTLANYQLVREGSIPITINGVSYDPVTYTTMLGMNGGAALPDGKYTLTVRGSLRDILGAPIGTEFVRSFFVDATAPHSTSIVALPNRVLITNGATLNVRVSSIQITFDEDLYDPAGNVGKDDVTNPSNYVLVSPGLNGTFDKISCTPGLAGGDVQIFTGPVTYEDHGDSGPFVATIQLNGGTALSNGRYRLFLCGSTSLVDLAGNALNNRLDEMVTFNVLVTDPVTSTPLHSARHNPRTGFAPGVVTVLPEQPVDNVYTDLGDLWIEIPRLKVKSPITGVPFETDGWDVTWLNTQVGWLEGTAYPTWAGNTVLTAHGYTADGEAGPFASLKDLSYGDTIVIHFGDMKYIYGLRTNLLIDPNDIHWLTQHETLDWVTLMTCQQYDAKTASYRYRRIVRAVLLRLEEE